MQLSKLVALAALALGVSAQYYEYDHLQARDGLAVRDALEEAHEIAMRSDPDLFVRSLQELGKRGCVQDGRGTCLRFKCSTSGYFCWPNGCACT